MKERANTLAAAHWSYIESVLEAHGAPASEVDIARFHYQTAFEHGWGHGVEDASRTEIASPAEVRIDIPLPGTPRYDEIHRDLKPEEVERIGRQGLDGEIIWQERLPLEKPNTPEEFQKMYMGNWNVPKPLDFRLPSIALPCTAKEAWQKYEEEWTERNNEKEDTLNFIVETWDCLQALRTYEEHGGEASAFIDAFKISLQTMHNEGRPVMFAKGTCLAKNATREYYAPAVNAAILSDTWTPDTDI